MMLMTFDNFSLSTRHIR